MSSLNKQLLKSVQGLEREVHRLLSHKNENPFAIQIKESHELSSKILQREMEAIEAKYTEQLSKMKQEFEAKESKLIIQLARIDQNLRQQPHQPTNQVFKTTDSNCTRPPVNVQVKAKNEKYDSLKSLEAAERGNSNISGAGEGKDNATYVICDYEQDRSPCQQLRGKFTKKSGYEKNPQMRLLHTGSVKGLSTKEALKKRWNGAEQHENLNDTTEYFLVEENSRKKKEGSERKKPDSSLVGTLGCVTRDETKSKLSNKDEMTFKKDAGTEVRMVTNEKWGSKLEGSKSKRQLTEGTEFELSSEDERSEQLELLKRLEEEAESMGNGKQKQYDEARGEPKRARREDVSREAGDGYRPRAQRGHREEKEKSLAEEKSKEGSLSARMNHFQQVLQK